MTSERAADHFKEVRRSLVEHLRTCEQCSDAEGRFCDTAQVTALVANAYRLEA